MNADEKFAAHEDAWLEEQQERFMACPASHGADAACECGWHPARVEVSQTPPGPEGNEMSALDDATDEELWAEVEARQLANIVGYINPDVVSERFKRGTFVLALREVTDWFGVYPENGEPVSE